MFLTNGQFMPKAQRDIHRAAIGCPSIVDFNMDSNARDALNHLTMKHREHEQGQQS